MDLIYSSQPVDAGGRKAVNPKFFLGPVAGVKHVYLNGEYPRIKAAYEEAGVKVSPISEMPKPKPADDAAKSMKGA